MKKLLVLLLSTGLCLSLVGCDSKQTTPTPTPTNAPSEGGEVASTIKIGANIYSGTDNFMNGVVKPALEDTAKALGAEINLVDSLGDQATLNNQVDTFINSGVNVLVINLVDPAAAGSIIEKAKNADIPLVLFNKEATDGSMGDYDKVWYVGTDSKESGVIQGDLMAKDILANPTWDKNGDGVIQYVMLKGEAGHPDAEARTEYSVKTMVDAGIKVEELAIQPSQTWATADGEANLSGWLTQYKDGIELVISNNDGMAFGAATAMEKADVQIPLYGVDALAQALTMIEEGTMQGTVLNDGVNQAKASIELAINAANGKEVTEGTEWKIENETTKAVRVPYVGINSTNVAEFK